MDPIQRNIRLYPWYKFAYGAFFWFPVFFLYFSSKVPLSQVLALEAIYYLCVFVFEVPSGYFSDRVGRALTLRISAGFLVLSYVNFYLGETFAQLAMGQVFLALGFAFNSGTDTVFHYDSLSAAGAGEEYGDREARAENFVFLSGGLAALVGGAAAAFELRNAYGLSALAALVGLGITLTFREPPRSDKPVERFDRHIRACVARLSDPHLRWLFVFSLAMIVVVHVPYQFYQPYLDALNPPTLLAELESGTPLASGIHAFIVMLIGSRAAAWSMKIRRRLGLRATLLIGLAALIAIIAAMGVVLHWALVIVLLFRSMPKALTAAPINASITPRLPQQLRASYLSMQSLAGRLGFGILLATLSYLSPEGGASFEAISPMLLVSAAVAGVVWLYLLVTAGNLDDE